VRVHAHSLERKEAMHRLIVVSFALVALAILAPASLRASCGSESCPLDHMSRWSENPFSFDVSYQYIDQDQPRISSEDASVGEIPRDHDEVRTLNRQTTARAIYRVGSAWSFSAALPWIDRYHEHIHEGEVERFNYDGDRRSRDGVYRVWWRRERRRAFLSGGGRCPPRHARPERGGRTA
jgi:hypothetical protein